MKWNAGAWFGSQIGGTAWMFVLALVTARPDQVAALVAAGAFVACNAAGWWLWTQRDRWSSHHAIQTLLVIIGVATVVVTVVMNQRGAYAIPYWLLVIFPAVMGLIRVRELRGAASTSESTAGA